MSTKEHPTAETITVKAHKRRLYELWLELGDVAHVLSNHCDPDEGSEILERIMEKLEEEWR